MREAKDEPKLKSILSFGRDVDCAGEVEFKTKTREKVWFC